VRHLPWGSRAFSIPKGFKLKKLQFLWVRLVRICRIAEIKHKENIILRSMEKPIWRNHSNCWLHYKWKYPCRRTNTNRICIGIRKSYSLRVVGTQLLKLERLWNVPANGCPIWNRNWLVLACFEVFQVSTILVSMWSLTLHFRLYDMNYNMQMHSLMCGLSEKVKLLTQFHSQRRCTQSSTAWWCSHMKDIKRPSYKLSNKNKKKPIQGK
jgi:hypothetical protein